MIAFEVHGKPVAMGRHRQSRFGNHTDKASAAAKQTIRTWAMVHCKEVWTGPVIMDLRFVFKPPASKRDRLGKFHTHKPDVDNLAKLVKDALNGVAYTDDSQVALLTARKIWGDQAKTVITLRKGDET